MFSNISTLLVILLAVAACRGERVKILTTQSKLSQEGILETKKIEDLEVFDEDGNIEDLNGLVVDSQLSKDSGPAEAKDFRDLVQSDEEILTFDPPEHSEAYFSSPLIVKSGSSGLIVILQTIVHTISTILTFY